MKPVRLLYLEDDELDRRAFFRMVREKALPYEVTAAGTLAEVRSRLAESQFDLILADYHLPDGHATELFDEVKDIPFILLTGTLEEQLALRTLERGADDYLPKQSQGQHLQALPFAIEKTMHRKRIRETEQRLTRELQESQSRLAAEAAGLARLNEASLRLWRSENLHAGLDEMMAATIELLGADTVEMAGDVATALEMANQQSFDLLLSDLGLPDGSGHDLMRELRVRGHKFPGIALSGYGQENDLRQSREAGFAAHLTKPASREALVEAIAAVTTEKPATTSTSAGNERGCPEGFRKGR